MLPLPSRLRHCLCLAALRWFEILDTYATQKDAVEEALDAASDEGGLSIVAKMRGAPRRMQAASVVRDAKTVLLRQFQMLLRAMNGYVKRPRDLL